MRAAGNNYIRKLRIHMRGVDNYMYLDSAGRWHAHIFMHGYPMVDVAEDSLLIFRQSDWQSHSLH